MKGLLYIIKIKHKKKAIGENPMTFSITLNGMPP